MISNKGGMDMPICGGTEDRDLLFFVKIYDIPYNYTQSYAVNNNSCIKVREKKKIYEHSRIHRKTVGLTSRYPYTVQLYKSNAIPNISCIKVRKKKKYIS